MPKGQLMGVPGDLKALARSGVLSWGGLLRAGLDRFLPRTPVHGDVSVADHIGARMGRQVVERLVEPLLGGVYAGRADRLSLDSTLPQIAPLARTERSLLQGVRTSLAGRGKAPTEPGPVFASLHGGLAGLIDTLAERLGDRLRTGTRVRALERREQGWLVHPEGDRPLECDAVLLACPAPEAARLLHSHAPEAAADLNGVDYASMALVTFALPASAFPEPPEGTGFLVPADEGLTVKAATFSSNKWPWLAGELAGSETDQDLVVLRCSIGRFGESAVLERSDEDLAAVALADLARVTGVAGTPVQTRITRWDNGLPQYSVGHADRIARVRGAVGRHPGLGVCGAAYGGVGIPACIADAGREARRLAEGLSLRPQTTDATNQQGVSP